MTDDLSEKYIAFREEYPNAEDWMLESYFANYRELNEHPRVKRYFAEKELAQQKLAEKEGLQKELRAEQQKFEDAQMQQKAKAILIRSLNGDEVSPNSLKAALKFYDSRFKYYETLAVEQAKADSLRDTGEESTAEPPGSDDPAQRSK